MKKQIEKQIKNIKTEIETIVSNESTSKSQKMKDLFEIGLEVKEIANLLEVRYNFVYNVISNYVNINEIQTVTEKKDSKKDKVIELFLNGKTNIEISKELKTNYNYICKIIKEYKVEQEKEVVNK